MQQSKKLQAENDTKAEDYITAGATSIAVVEESVEKPILERGGTIQIRPIKMYNEFVAILQERHIVKEGLLIETDQLTRPEGVIVGINQDGWMDNRGVMRQPQVQLGDRVAFQATGVLQRFQPDMKSDLPYKGETVIILSERNLIFKLATQLPFEIIA